MNELTDEQIKCSLRCAFFLFYNEAFADDDNGVITSMLNNIAGKTNGDRLSDMELQSLFDDIWNWDAEFFWKDFNGCLVAYICRKKRFESLARKVINSITEGLNENKKTLEFCKN